MTSKEKLIQRSIISIIIIIFISIAILVLIEKAEKSTYAVSESVQKDAQYQNLEISEAQNIDLDQIIQKNSVVEGYREEIIVKHEELEYITKYQNNPNLYIGTTEISEQGRTGIQAITTKKIYDENGKFIKEEQVSAVVVKAAINKIIEVGTKKKEIPKPKNKVYIGSTSGNLNFNMALNKPSGFSLEQFTKALTDSKDKNKIFQNNAKYFYYVEDQYGINGMFVAALGIHESAWGTSKIARNKNNLFGYGAYDSNPYNGAYTFEDYGESIDLVSKVLVKYYLNPKGTTIYDGGKASGKYYNGNTLYAVNKKYATDKNWAKGVFYHMQYLYGKIGK